MLAEKTPFITDILSQPDALQSILTYDFGSLNELAKTIQQGKFDRIIMTGMGASYYAAYPAWLVLTHSALPAIWVDTAELLHYAKPMLTNRTLLWVISQSGRSAEILSLLELVHRYAGAFILATTNDLASPLANAANLTIPITAAPEKIVSTRTYTNTLALTQLAAHKLTRSPLEPHLEILEKTIASSQGYLEDWQSHLRIIHRQVGVPRHLVLLGRGSSMAAVYSGALYLAEAAKFPALAMNSAEFRHGPLEICNPELTALVFEGLQETASLNRRLLQDLLSFQVRAFWISPQPETEIPALPMPQAEGIGLPIAEILPLQLLCVSIATLTGKLPEKLSFGDKVTTHE